MTKMYAVFISSECDDNYYPDYDYLYCICSTKEKADRVVELLYERNKNADPVMFSDARAVEYVLDDVEELDNDQT